MYLDHGATTPVRPEAISAMTAELRRVGNPSSLHGPGREARARVEEWRERIAPALGARASEIVFTSGGTESDNLAVQGTYRHRRAADPRRRRLVVGAIEHSAVIDVVQRLVEREGASVTWVPCGADGIVTPGAVAAAIEGPGPDGGEGGPDTVALVSVMWVNNEIGTVQPLPEIVAVAHGHGIPVHTDAVQAVGHVPVDVAGSGVDLLVASGHKLGGPAGVGVLVARRDAPVEPISFGGGQERGLRSGTLATHLIAGLGAALPAAVERREAQAAHLVALRDRLLSGVLEAVPGAVVTGAWAPGDSTRRSPVNAHVLLPDCEGDALLFLLDAAGIACSTGSACHAGVPRPSHVVLALGHDEARARGALRLTLGHSSSDADVDALLSVLPACVDRAQRAHRARAARKAS